MPADSPATRRSDAERNRDKILLAARAAFAEPGPEVSMAEISRRAGVGMATLYRNFPGRRELLEVLYADEVDAVCRAADRATASTAGARLTAWLRRFAAFLVSKHPIAAGLLQHAEVENPLFESSRSRVLGAGAPLLAEAQRLGEVRADLTLEQILDMVVAITGIDNDTWYVEAILQSALDGLQMRD